MPTDERISVILDSDDEANLVAIGDGLNVEVVNGNNSSSDSDEAEED